MTARRVLLLGNSHLGALKLGWDAVGAACPDIELAFFGAPADWTQHADLVDGAISTKHEPLAQKFIQVSGMSSTNVHHFDAIVFVGMFFGFTYVLRLMRTVHLVGMPALRPKSQLVSTPCLEQVFVDYLTQSPAIQWAKKVKAGVDKPLWLIPAPLPAENIVNVDQFIRPVSAQFRSFIQTLHQVYVRAATRAAASAHLTLLKQPISTIASAGFTKTHFSRDSLRLLGDDRKHNEEDYNHMNREFGIEMLNALIDSLRCFPDFDSSTMSRPGNQSRVPARSI